MFSARESPKVSAVQRVDLVSLTLDRTSKNERVVEPPTADALVCAAFNRCAVFSPSKGYWGEDAVKSPKHGVHIRWPKSGHARPAGHDGIELGVGMQCTQGVVLGELPKQLDTRHVSNMRRVERRNQHGGVTKHSRG
jgi:hypothetical protein